MEDFLSRLNKRILSETQGNYPRQAPQMPKQALQPEQAPVNPAAAAQDEARRRANILSKEEELLRLRLANERRKARDAQAKDLKRLGGVEEPGRK